MYDVIEEGLMLYPGPLDKVPVTLSRGPGLLLYHTPAVVAVQDAGWLPVLTITDLSVFV